MSARRTRIRKRQTSRGGLIALQVLAVMLVLILGLAGTGALVAGATVSKWLENLPDYNKPGAFDVAQATRIYSADGKLLARLYLENREVVPIEKMSPYLLDAIVAVEDERFYKHHGVDTVGLGRAVVVNLTQGFGTEGASTITQQYIRNTILLDERTQISLARKVREAYLAMQLEKHYDKRQILGMYLNAIYFGEGAYGAQAASRTYFAKPASQLTLGEAAMLAGLPQQPSRLDPYENPEGAVSRRNEVLQRMLKNGYITQAELDTAEAEALHLERAKTPEDGIYSAHYFVAHVKKELQAKFSPAVVFKGGLVVHTSLDTRLQKYAEAAVKNALPNKSDPRAALVSIDPRNGYVKALVGGRDYHKSKFNLATQGKRQPGSSFKTFVLVTALDKGMPPSFNIDSSSPAYIPTKPKPWVVGNSEGSGHGMISLASATHASVNTVFARVAWEIGIKSVVKTAHAMGITTKIPNYPSVALGAANVTPYEMASAYGTLATGGIHHDPVVITKVEDSSGEVIYKAKTKGKRVVRKSVAVAATNVLKGVITGGTARRAQIGRPAAGKTGTSQNYRDAWFVGYTPQLVTAIWVGHATERTIFVHGSHAFGGTVAAPIWATFMKKALKGQKIMQFPTASSPHYTPSKFHIPMSRPPSTTGMTLAAAKAKLKGYKFTIDYAYSNKPKGTVISQTVKGSTLVLVVSKGPKPSAPKPPPVDPGPVDPPPVDPPPDTTSTPTP
ncbi:MAG: penicillin-binding protein [Actinobacteria bacterium HGW-Actinobacteria-7]|nr:MAG: penicillin-binding protein [Actinobacteria bacterium HGW-Actinobacteria-7]